MFSRYSQDVCRIFPGCFQDASMGLVGLVEFQMIISNESMDLNDPKELDDPHLFDYPSYSMIPSYLMIPIYSMIPSYSMINWKYGVWKSKSLRWYLHHWWSCFAFHTPFFKAEPTHFLRICLHTFVSGNLAVTKIGMRLGNSKALFSYHCWRNSFRAWIVGTNQK